jgi:hypothetical protein
MAIKVQSVVQFIRTKGTADAGLNQRGNQIHRLFMPDERYLIDFAPDFAAEGWQQFDTDQDAHYFGVWMNPKHRLTLTYAEGDWSLVECPDDAHYNAEVRNCCEFYGDGRIARVIDPAAGTVTDLVQDRAGFLIA